jgi:hypothetical protein
MAIWWPLDKVSITGAYANSPGFYAQFGQQGHNGIDLAAGVGTAVFAADSGVIEFEGWGQNHNWMGKIAGISVIIRHAWGYTGYAHLSNTVVNRGQSVARGQQIGASGATGVGTGPHLHFETFPAQPNFQNGFAGRVNPSTYGLVARGGAPTQSLNPTERQTKGEPANRRNDPSTNSAPVPEVLAANTIGNFDGWIYGESVEGNNVWFRGNPSKNWFWSGSFTSTATTGLTDLNPKAPAPSPVLTGQRKVNPLDLRVRSAANTTAKIIKELPANSAHPVEGWVNGEVVDGVKTWFRVANGYAWAGGFTDKGTSGLKDLNGVTPPIPPVVPPVAPPVIPAKKPIGPVLATIPNWDESAPLFSKSFKRPVPSGPVLELPSSITVQSQVPTEGYNVGREATPNHIVLHHTASPRLQSVLNTLSGAGNSAPTSNYVIKDGILVGMVDERDTPATNDRWKSNAYSITYEVCNDATLVDKPSAASHETTAWAVARAALRWDLQLPLAVDVNVFGHRDVTKFATACPGELDMVWITKRANEIIEKAKPVDPVPTPPVSGDLEAAINELTAALKEQSALMREIYNR